MEADAEVIASVCWLKASLTAHKVLPADRSNDYRCALARTLVVGMGRLFSKKVEKDEKKEKHSLISDKKEF